MAWYLDGIDPRMAPSDASDPGLFVAGFGPNYGKQMTAVSWDYWNQYFGYAAPSIAGQLLLVQQANNYDAYDGPLFP